MRRRFKELGAVAAFAAMALVASVAAAQHRDDGDALSGHTFLFWDASNGHQIEYLARGGGAFLWYPTERETLVGAWRLRGDDICFIYPGRTDVGPNDMNFDDDMCMTLEFFFATTFSKRAGDVFDLQSGAPPFVLDFDDYFSDFDAVFSAAGR